MVLFCKSSAHTCSVATLIICREEHIARKMEQMVQEAKAKMAKGDKKGKSIYDEMHRRSA